MQPLHIFTVTPNVPKKLQGLWRLAYNLWFAWNDESRSLFSQIDQRLWEKSQHNPVWMLNHLSQYTLDTLAEDSVFCARLEEACKSLDAYTGKRPFTIATSCELDEECTAPSNREEVVYFSLEYGIAPCLPIYSGGLGILAGDHLKSASDLNMPLSAIGLAYQHGYFHQYMTPDGWQQEWYPEYDFEQLPMQRVLTSKGTPLTIELHIENKPLHAQLWSVAVGRIALYLLDTNIPENSPEFRKMTARLYGGSTEMRLWQEILLGIGGIRALQALGINPRVIHMNEGHSAFAGLERARHLMNEHNLSFESAVDVVASGSVFTTHTPVPAGNDRFQPALMHKHFASYAESMGISFKDFMALGREVPSDDDELFCMTVLALRLSYFNNGVSLLHGEVSRAMWKRIWHQHPVQDVPIQAITNGVHAPTWIAPDIKLLYDRYLGSNWREDPDCARAWSFVDTISNAELWRTHSRLRERLVDFARQRLCKQLKAQGARQEELRQAEDVLNPDVLTIGFARRFATYKRATLLLQDRDRLIRLVQNTEQPVQFIFAGKAHPQDQEGKQLIKELITLCRTPECRMKMVFLEDYDMEVASYLISGCDIWLNTPRRPLEACGTSGMKAMLNGVLQCSTRDGWWDEAYKEDNSLGWAIGKGESYEDTEYQDFVEVQTLYTILENEIIPEFYARGQGGIPRGWVRKMKYALTQLAPRFNAHRMLVDYQETAYMPALHAYSALAENDFALAKELSDWRAHVTEQWKNVTIRDVQNHTEKHIHVGAVLHIKATLHLSGINPDHVRVEIYAGTVQNENNFSKRELTQMHVTEHHEDGSFLFTGTISPQDTGKFGFTIRVMPQHPLLPKTHCMHLVHWAH